jgi:hypothetical protein
MARRPTRKAGVLDPGALLPVRDGLSAGGKWIRTTGSGIVVGLGKGARSQRTLCRTKMDSNPLGPGVSSEPLSEQRTVRSSKVLWIDRIALKTQEDEGLQCLPPQCRDAGQSPFFLFLLGCDAG